MQRLISASSLANLLSPRAAGTGAAYQELAGALRRLIADGRVTDGVRLPSERELTTALGVSRTTITRAYDLLREQGYLRSRRGSGSVAVLPGGRANRRTGPLIPGAGDPDAIDLTCAALGAPPGFLAAAETAVAALPAHLGGRGYHPYGLPELRAAVAAQYDVRGLPTDPEQIMVTSGALSGVAAALQAMLGAGDRVLMESPSYPNAVAAARRSGARPVALPLDPTGWDGGAFAANVRQTSPRAAYLIPDFHNPTGALMGEDQRREFGRVLQVGHTVALIDETFVALQLDDSAMPRPFAAFHPRTVTVGGAGKSFWGGLRVGWIRAPREEFGAIADARLTFDLSPPLIEQLVLLELMRDSKRLLDERRDRVRTSRDALAAALRERLPEWRFHLPAGGLSLWVELPSARSVELSLAAERHGLMLPAGPQFAVEGGLDRYLRIPYTDLEPELLATVVDKLAVAWQEARTVTATSSRRTRLVA